MMLTQDRPIIVGDAPTDRNHEFLFIEGDRIVGHVYADCAVYAWKAGHHLCPVVLLASWCGNGGRPHETLECVIEHNSRRRMERES